MRLGLLVLAALFFPRPDARGLPVEAHPSGAKEGGKLLASKEPGWPQWRGPRRDGISDEKNLLQSWPAGGPPLLWKTEGLGRGWSSPVVTGGSIYLTGDVGEERL